MFCISPMLARHKYMAIHIQMEFFLNAEIIAQSSIWRFFKRIRDGQNTEYDQACAKPKSYRC